MTFISIRILTLYLYWILNTTIKNQNIVNIDNINPLDRMIISKHDIEHWRLRRHET